MKGRRTGFTLIEVSLFLAVTALLFFGVTLGVRGSIFQQRYTDSVQNFAEFLRSAYSETMNVEHAGTGRTEQAVYGKMITFGEAYDLNGNKISDGDNRVFSYTVVGSIGDIGSGDVIGSLKTLNANVAVKDGSTYRLAGITQEYVPRWGAGIQTTAGYSSGYKPFKGTLLIVRHPRSGTVYTFYYSATIEVNGIMRGNNTAAKRDLLVSKLTTTNFVAKELDFCINPSGAAKTNTRRDVRLVENARNASGIEIINQDSAENRCK
ncbi:hypothetical protein IKE13_03105 [Candidatus Saccharibacteria bacterium]|nr:hypothetical protein [Candidatus Saccharibacteria bacterium]